MKVDELIKELSKKIPVVLAEDIVKEFIDIKVDVQSVTFGNSASGKFIESVVQTIQYLENGTFENQPKVDAFLKGLESRSSILDDDFRITLQRIARAQYTLRNKRNIAHKGEIAPNISDLRLIYSTTQWILSELVRKLISDDKDKATAIIEFIQIPANSIIEDFTDRKIIFGNLTIPKEILILLHSNYPNFTNSKAIQDSLERRSKSAITNSLKKLWNDKDVYKNETGYKLTQQGFQNAVELIKEINAST
ncbi:MAG: hypothetical protein K9G70_14165 [Prolixibacteraceae bacterium]|nr:hypothetical protein [Prolixibacteraceae bacterium]